MVTWNSFDEQEDKYLKDSSEDDRTNNVLNCTRNMWYLCTVFLFVFFCFDWSRRFVRELTVGLTSFFLFALSPVSFVVCSESNGVCMGKGRTL